MNPTTEVNEIYTTAVLDDIASIAIRAGPQDQECLDNLPRAIREWASLYLRLWREEVGRQSWKEISNQIGAARKTATKLITQIDEMSPDVTALFWREADECAEDDSDMDSVLWVEQLEVAIASWESLARAATKRASKKKGGPQGKSRAVAVRREAVGVLGSIWLKLTGLKPKRRVKRRERIEVRGGQEFIEHGEFKDFVVACLAPLSPLVGLEPSQGIDDDIRAVSEGMAEKPDDYWLRISQPTD